jgi:hypothetical protein
MQKLLRMDGVAIASVASAETAPWHAHAFGVLAVSVPR